MTETPKRLRSVLGHPIRTAPSPSLEALRRLRFRLTDDGVAGLAGFKLTPAYPISFGLLLAVLEHSRHNMMG